ncbi:MAG TPA: hypothetical protein VJZ49_12265 [Syntrophales bacterium]|nr:hypothetical protein [Syntrophales bacterium]
MTFSFVCPVPCSHEIRVYAENDDDALIELMVAGALRCRNTKYRCHCEKAQRDMPPISEEKLKQIVKTCMREEDEKQEGYNGILASLYG